MTPLLSVEDVGFSYPADPNGDGWTPFSLRSVTFALDRGDLLGVLGPNGGGKSTLLRLLCRSLRPASGEIRVEGTGLATMPSREVARRVALVPQEMFTVFAISVEQMVSLGLFPHSAWFGWRPAEEAAFLEEILRQTDLWPLRHRLTTHLSGGERRRVLLARALAQRPRVLLLDEPTAHLDPRHQVDFLRLLDVLRREKGLGVVVVLHDLNLALSWCPRILMMKDGALAAQGATADVLTEELFARVYGVTGRLSRAPGGRHLDFFNNIPKEAT